MKLKKSDASDRIIDLEPVVFYDYVSYVADRKYGGKFRRHQTLAHARSAITGAKEAHKGPFTIYKWEGDVIKGEWVFFETL